MDVSIVLKVSKQEFALGENVSIDVTYRNDNDSNCIFRDPAKTWEVMLYVQKKSESQVHRFPFGKIISKTDSLGITSESVEPADDITIGPKEMYTFYPSTYGERLSIFDPGIYTLKVVDRTDDEATRNSNELEIIVKATEASFEMLLAICTDERNSQDNREFAVYWLRHFHSDFGYSVSASTEQQKELNKKMIIDMHAWWSENKGTSEVKKTIFLINKQAGIVNNKD